MSKYEEDIALLEDLQDRLICDVVKLAPGSKERIKLHNAAYHISNIIEELKNIEQ